MTTKSVEEKVSSPERTLQAMLDHQVKMSRVCGDDGVGKPLMSTPSVVDDDPADTAIFVALRIPHYQSFKTAFGQKSRSSMYVRYIWDQDVQPTSPSFGYARIPFGVQSCNETFISCTLKASSWSVTDLLRELFKKGLVTAKLHSSFHGVEDSYGLPLLNVLVEAGCTSTSSMPTLDTSQPSSAVHELTGRPKSNTSSMLSFKTARSKLSLVSVRSARSNSTFHSMSTRGESIREDEAPDPGLPKPLLEFHYGYYTSLHHQNMIQILDKELNWSGKGQHVTFAPSDEIPLRSVSHLGSSNAAIVDKVICRRIALARKTMRCDKRWTVADASREACHLQKFRHFHIVQLVGTYLRGRNFSILMYPVADSHLGTFLDETCDMPVSRDMDLSSRRHFLATSFGCLAAALAFIHNATTKHMDIKPQNILVRYMKSIGKETWRIYIADFGFSRSFGSQDQSQTDGPTSRTPRYCSPEVYNDEPRGRPADIFSLGCVFLEMICVLGGEDLLDFAEARRGSSDDESFHGNLERVYEWARASLRRQTLPKTFVWTCDSATFKLITVTAIRMLSREPSLRPTAAQIRELTVGLSNSSFFPCLSCSLAPEQYERYEPNDTS